MSYPKIKIFWTSKDAPEIAESAPGRIESYLGGSTESIICFEHLLYDFRVKTILEPVSNHIY